MIYKQQSYPEVSVLHVLAKVGFGAACRCDPGATLPDPCLPVVVAVVFLWDLDLGVAHTCDHRKPGSAHTALAAGEAFGLEVAAQHIHSYPRNRPAIGAGVVVAVAVDADFHPVADCSGHHSIAHTGPDHIRSRSTGHYYIGRYSIGCRYMRLVERVVGGPVGSNRLDSIVVAVVVAAVDVAVAGSCRTVAAGTPWWIGNVQRTMCRKRERKTWTSDKREL